MQYGSYAVDYEQRPYNPDRMRKERVERAQAALKKHGLGAMILYDYDYHRYLGYYSYHQYARRRLGTYVLLVQGEGFPYVNTDKYDKGWESLRMPWFEGKMVLKTSKPYQLCNGLPDTPDYMENSFEKNAAEIKTLLKKHDILDMPVGIDVASAHMLDVLRRNGINVVDGNNCMVDAIRVKTEDEIHCLRMAGAITEAAHWEVARALRPGMTELEIAGIAAHACYKHGAEELEGPSFVVCTGERSGYGVPNMPTDRMVRPGDFVVLDINGVSFNGYRTCFYRTYLVGDKPTEFQKEVYAVAYEALIAMTESVKPGITTSDVQNEWLKKGDAPGLWGREPKWPEPGRYFFGSGGHPIGLRSGDPGATIPGSGEIFGDFPGGRIEKNMTFALETACFTWLGDRWAKDGVKIEHCGVVTDDGFEVFYRFPKKELIVCGLPGVY
ncbi:MAG: Xaa-Pro peptidase family protein [Bacillota bacterium]